MTGYAASVIPVEIQALRERAAKLVGWLPEGMRCHEVARAVGEVLGLPVVDGRYGCVNHSWLVVDGYILDVYCVGRLPLVQVVDMSPTLPHRSDYQEGTARGDIDHAAVASAIGTWRRTT